MQNHQMVNIMLMHVLLMNIRALVFTWSSSAKHHQMRLFLFRFVIQISGNGVIKRIAICFIFQRFVISLPFAFIFRMFDRASLCLSFASHINLWHYVYWLESWHLMKAIYDHKSHFNRKYTCWELECMKGHYEDRILIKKGTFQSIPFFWMSFKQPAAE